MEFIKLNEDRYMIKGSNNFVVSKEEKLKLEKKELIVKDIKTNGCTKEVKLEINKVEEQLNEINSIKKARKSTK